MRNSRTFAIYTVCLLVNCIAMRVAGSAIPMWEFLSRDEKMSHLYRVFSKQVARFCADSSRPDCNKNLLVTGIRNLASMEDIVLDKLDPYQRGAKEMIWRAMVGTSRFSSRISQESEEPYFTTGTDPLATAGSETNGLAEEIAPLADYVRPSPEHTGPYLVGPMVIRVYPDGRPVPEDSTRPLPRDEDAEELRFARLPSIEEIEANSGNPFYGKSPKDPKRPPLASVKLRDRIVDPIRRPLEFDRRLLRDIPTEGRIRYY